jgi:hypothetical protein
MRDDGERRGIGGRACEIVELAVVQVREIGASTCHFELRRTQEMRPQAIERLVAGVD